MILKKSSGLLSAKDVKNGTSLKVVGEVTRKESAQGKTFLNFKVELPDGPHKLAGFAEDSLSISNLIDLLGEDTNKWTGKSFNVSVKMGNYGDFVVVDKVAGDELNFENTEEYMPELPDFLK